MVYSYNAKRKYIRNESIYEKLSQRTDPKVRRIYEQFHRGNVITMDDLRYMSNIDPEGCKIIIQAMMERREEQKDEHRKQVESAAIQHINQLERDVLQLQKHLNECCNRRVMNSKETLECVKESLANVKQIVLVMDQDELKDMMNHLNEVSELRKQYEDELLGWEMFLEETDRYYIPYDHSKLEYRV